MDNTIELINKLKDIPAMPNVIIKILQMIKDESSSITDLASMISYDQALCIKVLALVNSSRCCMYSLSASLIIDW